MVVLVLNNCNRKWGKFNMLSVKAGTVVGMVGCEITNTANGENQAVF